MHKPIRLGGTCAAAMLLFSLAPAARAQVNEVKEVAPRVYFHQGDIVQGHCNNAWVVLEDYVLVVDANFPSGAKLVLPKIRKTSDRPIRFAFDTHHHGDHAYGNQVWADQGATLVAHAGVLEEMKKYEPKRWDEAAAGRKDVAESKLKPPSLLYKTDMAFDDGKVRVELRHFGVAHTRGDGFAWLPNEGILFTGDACVNGPFNYVGDGNITEWIDTLERAKQLKPKIVCPGHGPIGGPEMLEDQQAYFKAVHAAVKALVDAKRTPEQVKAEVERIKGEIDAQPRIRKYLAMSFPQHVEKVYVELGGQPFDPAQAALEEKLRHAYAHARAHLLGAAHAHAPAEPAAAAATAAAARVDAAN
jgi:glyoxylase-like metal-dependent hydrolase (beta-lactamase superfamily II)